MNWDAIGAIGEIIGAMAVFVSLLYLAIQTKHNTRATKSASFHDVRMAFSDVSFGLAKDPDLIALISKGNSDPESLSNEEVLRYELVLMTILRRAESAYFQSEEGALARGSWEGILETCVTVLSNELARKWWVRVKHRFEKSFAHEIDNAI